VLFVYIGWREDRTNITRADFIDRSLVLLWQHREPLVTRFAFIRVSISSSPMNTTPNSTSIRVLLSSSNNTRFNLVNFACSLRLQL
jgi:hypothetical protein